MLVRRLWMAGVPTKAEWRRLFRSSADFILERQSEAIAEMSPDYRHELKELISPVGFRDYTEHGSRNLETLVDWAQRSGYAQTALHLAEAGAAYVQNDSHALFIAGRTNRLIGDAWRAEAFYRAAIVQAFRHQRWKDYICAQLGLGTLLIDRGLVSAAATRYLRAARAAADQGLEWLAAQTFHDLASLHFQRGNLKAAIKSVIRALQIYPIMNERVPVAVHDLAFLHVVAHSYHEAMDLLELVAALPLLPQDQVLISGTIARAAGALGLEARYFAAEAQVLHFAETHKQHADAAFVNLAYGAHRLGLWARAAEHAGRGARLAVEAKHVFVENVAWELLAEVASKKLDLPEALPIADQEVAAQLRALKDSLRDQLAGWRWNPEQSGPRKLRPAEC